MGGSVRLWNWHVFIGILFVFDMNFEIKDLGSDAADWDGHKASKMLVVIQNQFLIILETNDCQDSA